MDGFRPANGNTPAVHATEIAVPKDSEAELAKRVAELEERIRQLESAQS
jgi:hypothetical protein